MGANEVAGSIPYLLGGAQRTVISFVAKAVLYAAQADALERCETLDDVRAVGEKGLAAEDAVMSELTVMMGAVCDNP